MRIVAKRCLPRIPLSAVAALFLFNLSACDWMQMKDPREAGEARIAAARLKRVQQACASNRTYDRLKDLAFDQAIKIRNADPANLDRLATYSVIRMENPLVKSRDETLDVTVCGGHFILSLPPGAERGFNGATRLEADIEYTAQAAADGSGLIYQVAGADPIIYRLAAFDLQGHVYIPPAEQGAKLADAAPVAPTVPAPDAMAPGSPQAGMARPALPAAPLPSETIAAVVPAPAGKVGNRPILAAAQRPARPEARPTVADIPLRPRMDKKLASLPVRPAKPQPTEARKPEPKSQATKMASCATGSCWDRLM
jgi:hypothetical protein